MFNKRILTGAWRACAIALLVSVMAAHLEFISPYALYFIGIVQLQSMIILYALSKAAVSGEIKHVLPESSRELFQDKDELEYFNTILEEDPLMRQAINFCYKLNNEDFLRFVRVCVELRDQGNQTALKIASKHFRKSQ